jgi:hypothetical protein
MADAFVHERQRIGELCLIRSGWGLRISNKRRKTKGILDLLVEHPAIDSATLARLHGVSRRMALVLLHDLQMAGVVHEITGQYTQRVWIA